MPFLKLQSPLATAGSAPGWAQFQLAQKPKTAAGRDRLQVAQFRCKVLAVLDHPHSENEWLRRRRPRPPINQAKSWIAGHRHGWRGDLSSRNKERSIHRKRTPPRFRQEGCMQRVLQAGLGSLPTCSPPSFSIFEI